jgi:hypothetical protein
MMKKSYAALVGGIAVVAAVASPAMAEQRSVDLPPGFTRGPDAAAPRAAPGTATGYAVPMGANGGQGRRQLDLAQRQLQRRRLCRRRHERRLHDRRRRRRALLVGF